MGRRSPRRGKGCRELQSPLMRPERTACSAGQGELSGDLFDPPTNELVVEVGMNFNPILQMGSLGSGR